MNSSHNRTNSMIPEPSYRSQRHRNFMIWILVICSIIIIGSLISILPMMLSSLNKECIIRVPKNASMQQVEDSLIKYCGEKYTDKVMRLLKVGGFSPESRHGAYLLTKGSSPFQAARRIARGPQEPVTMVINGFRSLDYLADRLSKKYDFTKEEFLKAATDSAYLSKYGLTPENALSLFIEDSYETYWSATPMQLLDKVGQNYIDFWDTKRTYLAKQLGVTPAQMMILASIVDDETNMDDEKGAIGILYLNRLDQGMKLQADPTVKYALQDFGLRRITSKHTAVDSPYNTYMYPGLPPGPLRTTRRSTIQKILQAEPHDYIYMCAKYDFSGYHDFAVTYEEHQANARRYQRELDARNIK